MLKIWDLFTEASGLKADGRNKNAQEIWKILVDQQYGIGTVGQSPAGLGVRLVSQQAGQHRRPGLQRPALPHARQFAPGDLVLQERDAAMLAYLLRRLGLAAITICGDHVGDLHHPAFAAGRFRRLPTPRRRPPSGSSISAAEADAHAPRLRAEPAVLGAIL